MEHQCDSPSADLRPFAEYIHPNTPPLIFRVPYSTRPFYIGEIAPAITTSQYEYNNFIMECIPPQIDGFNMDKDGMTARAIKAQYGKNSVANFLRQNSYGATAVIEITPIPPPSPIGFYNERNGYFSEELSGTVTTHIGRSQHEFIIEKNEP